MNREEGVRGKQRRRYLNRLAQDEEAEEQIKNYEEEKEEEIDDYDDDAVPNNIR